MDLICPNCARPLTPDDVNLQTSIGNCHQCKRVFHLYDQIREASEESYVKKRPIIDRPDRYAVEQSGDSLEIGFRWFHISAIFLCLFVIAWFAFLTLWYVTMASIDGPMSSLALLVPVVHVAVGFFLLHKVTTLFLNRTTITAGVAELRVEHGPIPSKKRNLTLERHDLNQIFVQMQQQRNRNGPSFSVSIRKQDRTVVKLVDVDSQDEALFIEQQLERFYNIRDLEVEGEVPR